MKLAVYPGSFDPPTLGHLDVIERASRLFDEIIVAVGRNVSKVALLETEERMDAIRESTRHLGNVRIDSFAGLLIDYAKQMKADAVVRGLRATSDFDYEFQMAMVNRRLDTDIESVFLMTRWDYSYLSSSIVREVATLGGDFANLVPTPVVPIVRKALDRRR